MCLIVAVGFDAIKLARSYRIVWWNDDFAVVLWYLFSESVAVWVGVLWWWWWSGPFLVIVWKWVVHVASFDFDVLVCCL